MAGAREWVQVALLSRATLSGDGGHAGRIALALPPGSAAVIRRAMKEAIVRGDGRRTVVAQVGSLLPLGTENAGTRPAGWFVGIQGGAQWGLIPTEADHAGAPAHAGMVTLYAGSRSFYWGVRDDARIAEAWSVDLDHSSLSQLRAMERLIASPSAALLKPLLDRLVSEGADHLGFRDGTAAILDGLMRSAPSTSERDAMLSFILSANHRFIREAGIRVLGARQRPCTTCWPAERP